MSSEFVHLHVHTEYSLLDGHSRIKNLVKRATELEMPALGITDHGVMYGVIDFFRECRDAGIKPVVGMEAYLAPRGMTDRDAKLDKTPFHMLLLAKNMTGYRNLLKMASAAQLEGYYYRPRIDRDFMAAHAEGVIATSGCLAAEIPRLVEKGKADEAREKIGWYQDVFGADNFYLELMPHDIDLLNELNDWLYEYRKSGHTDVQFIASNDLHYVLKDDVDSHDTLLCVQTSSLKSEKERMMLNPAGSYYMTTADEMRAAFGDAPPEMINEAFANTLKIAEMTDVELDYKGYHLPIFPVPEGFDETSYLHYLCDLGMDWRYGSRKDEAHLQQRLQRELGIIGDMGFNTYFLIVWDLCEFARAVDIWWNVRGSGAGSLVAYCLGITNIDPIQNSLLFERFLNPGRVSMPDIDIDYPDDRRGEMIAYAADKYGEDKVAAIITFGTMGAKASVKDVGKALGVDPFKINRVAKLIPQEARQKSLPEYIEGIGELHAFYDSDRDVKEMVDAATELQGMTRHASIHAAGVIISDKPLVEYIPLSRMTGKDPSGGSLKAVTQFPMETAESIGLLKVDFLGLSTLTIMRRTCELIERHHGISYSLENIPYRHDDTRRTLTAEETQMLDEAFELLGRGETIGVFQVESAGMQSMLRGMKPKRYENIIAGVSLYRPGPMDFIQDYNARYKGDEEVPYLHEKLEPILAETYGIIIYQEQIMQIAGELFGYELGKADLIRKAVSKKKQKELMEHKAIFLEEGPKRGISEEVAEKIFEQIEFFANYGFNKSHASDYAMVTVQTAFLKAHYPEEFMTAMLSVHHGDSAKVSTFLEECRRMHIPVLPPDVNYSMLDFDIEETADSKRGIRFGLAAIKNASSAALQQIIDNRDNEGIFDSLEDFCHRVNLRDVGKRTLESLVKVNAMSSFGDRNELLKGLDQVVSFSKEYHEAQSIGQISMFGGDAGFEDMLNLPLIPEKDRYGFREQLKWEKELLGLYVSGRPVDKYRDEFRQSRTTMIQALKAPDQNFHGEKVRIAGEISNFREFYTKNNELMVVMQLEDWHDTAGTIEVVIFPRTWKRVKDTLREEREELRKNNIDTRSNESEEEQDNVLTDGDIIIVEGKFDTERDEPQVIADNVRINLNVLMPDDQDDYILNIPETVLLYDEDGEVIGVGEVPVPGAAGRQTAHSSSINSSKYPPTNGHNGNSQYDVTAPMIYEAPATDLDFDTMTPPPDETTSTYGNSPSEVKRHIRVYVAGTKDANADRWRIKKLYHTFDAENGYDRFTIIIKHRNGKNVPIHFPHASTEYNPRLIKELLHIVGKENIEVLEDGKDITVQALQEFSTELSVS